MDEQAAVRAGAGPRIMVGGLQTSPDDTLPSPVVAVSYDSLEEATGAAKLLVAIQNGSRPFQSGPAIYMGDTRIKIRFLPGGTGGPVLCEVQSRIDPRHLTLAFYAAGTVSLDQVKAFNHLMDMARNYVFTVAHGERVLTQELYLVKYSVEERGIRS
jgi:hypothetical protein